MIPNTKYEDKAFMISELCQFFKSDELAHLDLITASCPDGMSKKEFDYLYTHHLKVMYLSKLENEKDYKRVSFETLHNKIMSAVRKDPKCRDKFKDEQKSGEDNSATKEKILAHIANIRKNQNQ